MNNDLKSIALYHCVKRRENFEKAASDLTCLLATSQKQHPNQPRILFLDIDGHRNKAGGFDHDMLELQKDFCLGFLLPFFTEMHLPLIDVANSKEQDNNVPQHLEIQNEKNLTDDSLNQLYLENYENTEFMSEEDVFAFLSHVSGFLKKFQETKDLSLSENVKDPFSFMHSWSQYMKNLIIELFNSFLYGNLLSVSAMTRSLVESYVYVSILLQEDSTKLLGEWSVCSLLSGIGSFTPQEPEAISNMIKTICQTLKLNENECRSRFRPKKSNAWLSSVTGTGMSFKKICEYLEAPEIYKDFESASSFVHGQDIVSKCFPFSFYNSICRKLFIMMSYVFKTIRLYPITAETEDELLHLEKELLELTQRYI